MKKTAGYKTLSKGFILFAIFLSSIILNCAEIKPPPGGPVDKTPPVLISSAPENGSVNVPLDNRIVLYFSEKVIPTQNRKAVFISPRPIKEPKIKWKGERVEIILPDSFKADETYIISTGANITDLRGNKLDSAGIIAFTTGPIIDTGQIAGQVLAMGNPKAGLMTALYNASSISDSTSFDSLYPVYLVQTNSEGRFRFRYLPQKQFHLIAFEDRNHDELFNPYRESFAVSDRLIDIGGNMPLDNLLLSTTSQDTLLPEILSVSYTSNALVHVRLSHQIETPLLAMKPSLVQLKNNADSSIVISAKAILETDQEETTSLTISAGKLSPGAYTFSLMYDTTKPALVYDELIVEKTEDKTPPTIVKFYPDNSPIELQNLQMQLVFSEPLDTTRFTDETITLWQGEDKQLGLERSWQDDFRLNLFSPDIEEGKSYRLTVTEFELADLAGNIVGDTLHEYTFSVFDTKTFGAVSGAIAIYITGKEDDPVVLHLKKTNGKQEYTMKVTDSTFNISVPAGQYLLSGFIDSDHDNRRGNGSVIPFRLAETQTAYPDTISVRTRFETAGIHLEFR